MEAVTVRVPASTSNLGPGFDCLGIALRLYNNVALARTATRHLDPIVREAGAQFFARTRCKPFAFSCAIDGNVPRARGLGSSVTVRLGVLHGLNELSGQPLDRHKIFELCAKLEGHPDNSAPAEFGGFNVVRDGVHQKFEVSPSLQFILFVPDFEIATSAARKILPAKINRLDAIQNCANACAVTAAFASRDYEKLHGAFGDHLHQPFRKKLVPFFDRVVAAAEKAGALGAFLSGSGSTIAALALQDRSANLPVGRTRPAASRTDSSRGEHKIAKAMRAAASKVKARVILTSADNRGAHILSIRK